MTDNPISRDAVLVRKTMRDAAVASRNLQKTATIATWRSTLCEQMLSQWPRPPGRTIGFCWPVQNEPDLRPVLTQWRQSEQNLICALPVVVAASQPLAFRAWQNGARMVTDRYGIPTPADGDFITPDVLLIPLNAYDSKGFRIGYGGGFFDRTLAALRPRPLSIGVGFEIGRVADTQPQPHDERLDWIVTEARVTKMMEDYTVRCS